MAPNRLPFRDPRTVARDIPGVLDILFPRLSGGIVASLNRKMFAFDGIAAIPDTLVGTSHLQKAMLFELSMARAEGMLWEPEGADWDACLRVAAKRQRRHYDAKIPDALDPADCAIADRAAQNLVTMLRSIQRQNPGAVLERAPTIPGLGWIASGEGDFSLGSLLVEVKHTDRNFGAGDFRQVLLYWLLQYAAAIEGSKDVWTHVVLLNPRRNAGLLVPFDFLLRSASENLGRVELYERLSMIVGRDLPRD